MNTRLFTYYHLSQHRFYLRKFTLLPIKKTHLLRNKSKPIPSIPVFFFSRFKLPSSFLTIGPPPQAEQCRRVGNGGVRSAHSTSCVSFLSPPAFLLLQCGSPAVSDFSRTHPLALAWSPPFAIRWIFSSLWSSMGCRGRAASPPWSSPGAAGECQLQQLEQHLLLLLHRPGCLQHCSSYMCSLLSHMAAVQHFLPFLKHVFPKEKPQTLWLQCPVWVGWSHLDPSVSGLGQPWALLTEVSGAPTACAWTPNTLKQFWFNLVQI